MAAGDSKPGTPWFVRRSDCVVYNVRGADRLDLLQRLTTNDVAHVGAGRGAATVLTSVKGRIVDLLVLYVDEQSVTMVGSSAHRTAVISHLERHTITDDFTVAVHDPAIAVIALSDLPPALSALTTTVPHNHVSVFVDDIPVRIAVGALWSGWGYHLLVDAAHAASMCATLLELGMRDASEHELRREHILRGVPGWGRELVDAYTPLDVAADAAVSYTKGCYVGQEVIARLHSYNKVQRTLCGVTGDRLEGVALPLPMFAGDGKIGELTSAELNASGDTFVGLCVARRESARSGTAVTVKGSDHTYPAILRGLPFNPVQ